ncbi:MAG TPA: aspartate kinase, partial [Chryseolinea sp.]
TNALVAISNALYEKDIKKAETLINELELKYKGVIRELFTTDPGYKKAAELLTNHFNFILSFTLDMFTVNEEKAILAQGELLSTALFHYHLEEIGVRSVLLPALNFMKIDADDEPDLASIEKSLHEELAKHPGEKLFITQGYICRNAFGEIDNLKRGGSDYSASIIGAVLNSPEIQIWTDIDGMHNNDPRIVKKTIAISELTFDEASELAYFGAKILHPSTIVPAQKYNVPVRLKNTMDEKAPGTIITEKGSAVGSFKAIAAKDGITAINIRSSRMLMAYGFLRRVFEVFENHKTSIDMITTSEVAVSLTIDNSTHLSSIENELKKFGTIEVDKDQTIICIVGQKITEQKAVLKKIFDALSDIPVRMVSCGGSTNNVSVLVEKQYKERALNALNEGLFGLK